MGEPATETVPIDSANNNNNNNNELNAHFVFKQRHRGRPFHAIELFAEKKRNGICMEERSVHCKCVGRNPRRQCAGY